MFPWSVMATDFCPTAATRSISLVRSQAPSSSEYSVCKCKCVNSDMDDNDSRTGKPRKTAQMRLKSRSFEEKTASKRSAGEVTPKNAICRNGNLIIESWQYA